MHDLLQSFDTKKQINFDNKDFIFNNEIKIQDLSFNYGNANELALKGINIKIDKGSLVGIIGKSGSGKSTLINILLGLLKYKNGTIKIDGVDLNDNLNKWQSLIGFVSQDIFLINDTIIKNIAFGISSNQIDRTKVSKCLDLANLSEFINRLPDGLNTVVGERGIRLSGGQLQRVGIARACLLYTSDAADE